MQIYTDNGFTLEENKEQILRHFKAVRHNKELGPIAYNGNLFDFDQKSYERINAAIITLSITGGKIYWTTADNNTVEVSANDLKGVVASASDRSNQLHIEYRHIKEEVNEAESNEELDVIYETWAK